MSYHKCYICNKDTKEKKGFLDTGTYIKVCSSCENKVREIIKKFPQHEERFSKRIIGLEIYNDSYIFRNMLEVQRNLNENEVIIDYLLGIFNSLKDTFIPGFYKGIILLTNKRLLYFIPKPKIGLGVKIGTIGNRFEYVGSINDIVEIVIETLKLDGSHIQIRDKGGLLQSFNKIITQEDPLNVENFVKNFQKIKNDLNSNPSNTSLGNTDSIENLKKIKDLYDEGILSEEEFLRKKTELLNRL